MILLHKLIFVGILLSLLLTACAEGYNLDGSPRIVVAAEGASNHAGAPDMVWIYERPSDGYEWFVLYRVRDGDRTCYVTGELNGVWCTEGK